METEGTTETHMVQFCCEFASFTAKVGTQTKDGVDKCHGAGWHRRLTFIPQCIMCRKQRGQVERVVDLLVSKCLAGSHSPSRHNRYSSGARVSVAS